MIIFHLFFSLRLLKILAALLVMSYSQLQILVVKLQFNLKSMYYMHQKITEFIFTTFFRI